MKETEIAKKAIEYFSKRGYEIYQEVQTDSFGTTTDIVVVKDGEQMAIEVKSTFNLVLISQAVGNVKIYNYSSVFVPASRYSNVSRNIAIEIARLYGIGVYEWNSLGPDRLDFNIRERGIPVKNYNAKNMLLKDEHKHYAEAGNADGKKWTPFLETVRNLKEYVKNNNGCRTRDALRSIDHHYASIDSGRGSIRAYIDSGVIKGLKIMNGQLFLIEEE